jgi:hypothetical protein
MNWPNYSEVEPSRILAGVRRTAAPAPQHDRPAPAIRYIFYSEDGGGHWYGEDMKELPAGRSQISFASLAGFFHWQQTYPDLWEMLPYPLDPDLITDMGL